MGGIAKLLGLGFGLLELDPPLFALQAAALVATAGMAGFAKVGGEQEGAGRVLAGRFRGTPALLQASVVMAAVPDPWADPIQSLKRSLMCTPPHPAAAAGRDGHDV